MKRALLCLLSSDSRSSVQMAFCFCVLRQIQSILYSIIILWCFDHSVKLITITTIMTLYIHLIQIWLHSDSSFYNPRHSISPEDPADAMCMMTHCSSSAHRTLGTGVHVCGCNHVHWSMCWYRHICVTGTCAHAVCMHVGTVCICVLHKRAAMDTSLLVFHKQAGNNHWHKLVAKTVLQYYQHN